MRNLFTPEYLVWVRIFIKVFYSIFHKTGICVLLITRLLRLVGGRALVNRFNHTSGAAVVTPFDSPKSVFNRCKRLFFFGDVFV